MGRYTPKTKDELKALVMDESIYLGDIDTSNITDMSVLFYQSNRVDFSGIEKWNTSNVKNMNCMFYGCSTFNQNINSWNVSNVESMWSMFENCHNFNQDLSSWDTSNVKHKKFIFKNTLKEFNFLQNKNNNIQTKKTFFEASDDAWERFSNYINGKDENSTRVKNFQRKEIDKPKTFFEASDDAWERFSNKIEDLKTRQKLRRM